MSAADVFTRLRVVSATAPASRKFQGTMRSASCSMRDWVSDLKDSACSTSATMERSFVSPASAVTRTMISPSSTAVPENTLSPTPRSTASGSPVRAAWFTMAVPRTTSPSTHTGMPVRTAMQSPGLRSDAATWTSWSPSTSCAVSGGRATRSRAPPPTASACTPPASRPGSAAHRLTRRARVALVERHAVAAASSTGTSSRAARASGPPPPGSRGSARR